MNPALADARDVLHGLTCRAVACGIPVPDGIALIVDTDACRRHRARAIATMREGQRVIALAWLPDRRLSLCERADLRGVVLHEMGHHVAGLEHGHREPFRRVLVALAKVFGSPLPSDCDEIPNRTDHPQHYLFACQPPAWLTVPDLPPRRLSQIRRVLGVSPERTQPAPRAPRTQCTMRQAVAFASMVAVCAAVLA